MSHQTQTSSLEWKHPLTGWHELEVSTIYAALPHLLGCCCYHLQDGHPRPQQPQCDQQWLAGQQQLVAPLGELAERTPQSNKKTLHNSG